MAYTDRFPIVKNFLETKLTADCDAGETTLYLENVDGLPRILAGRDYVPLVLRDAGTVREIVYVDAVDNTAGTVTVRRGQEGTTPAAWATGTYAYCTVTSDSFQRMRVNGFAPLVTDEGRPSISRTSATTVNIAGDFTAQLEVGMAVRVLSGDTVVEPTDAELGAIHITSVSFSAGVTAVSFQNVSLPTTVDGLDLGLSVASAPLYHPDTIVADEDTLTQNQNVLSVSQKFKDEFKGELKAEQALIDDEQDAKIAEALDKVGLPLGFEYTRLTGQTAPLGGVDYLGQTATRAMYADLLAWQRTNKPESFVTEARWQELYASQNGNVPFYSEGDGSTTFRFPRVVGYFKGAGSVDELGQYTKEGLPGHTHTRGTMNITGGVTSDDINFYWGAGTSASGAFSNAYVGGSYVSDGEWSGKRGNGFYFDASRSWTGETSEPINPLYGASDHVTPETVAVVMGVIAIGSVASIGEATEEGIVAELGEHGAKLGALEAAIEAFHDNCVGEIFSWSADSEPYRALPINGAAVSRTTYAKLFAKIGTKYGAGDGSTTFNVPNGIGKFLQCDNTAGTVKVAGLPNILGNFRSTGMGNSYLADGAFYTEGTIVGQNHAGGSADRPPIVYFNASRFNSIYGNSDTVQPPALTMRYYIKY